MGSLPKTIEEWMEFLDGGMKAVCDRNGWGRQVRRKWSVREKPVSDSPIDDYEWKLIPGSKGLGPAIDGPDCDEGRYYVFGVDTAREVFRVQHDTFHVGGSSVARCLSTFTEFSFDAVRYALVKTESGPVDLSSFVLAIVDRREPNSFSLT
jgi:hypothetical protein